MTERELLQQALDHIEGLPGNANIGSEIRAYLAQPPAKPLTDEQITDIYLSISSLKGWDLITEVVRKVEHAHGITATS
jgi:hypothetical protein